MSELDVIQGFFKKEQKDKIDKYRILNETVVKGQILFTGSSLMEQFPINELLMTEKWIILFTTAELAGSQQMIC